MKRILMGSLFAGVLMAAACEKTSPSTINSDAQVTVQFFRMCSPFRGRLEITVAEIRGSVGITLTALTVTMKDLGGTVRFTRALTSADLVALLGTNHINPARSRIVIQEGAYPGNVDTMDSTAIVEATIVDDDTNTITKTVNVGFQRDGC